MKKLFITGTYRSGTTLLEKMLHNHPQMAVASQPFPTLYFSVKEAFNTCIHLPNTPYPINEGLLQGFFQPEAFVRFLHNTNFSQAIVQQWLQKLVNYSGCYTPELFEYFDRFDSGNFFKIFNQLYEVVSELLPAENQLITGTKEIMAEDYIPALLQQKTKVVLIIRDPRDIITSANYSSDKSFVGDARPVLYSLRMWRKSVAAILEHEYDENFIWLRYEDLIADPLMQLNKLLAFLDLKEYPEEILNKGLKDQRNKLWSGNSSFGKQKGVEKTGAGKFKNILPENLIRLIESTSYPEMKLMDYACEYNPEQTIIKNLNLTDQPAHPAFSSGNYYKSAIIEEEMNRLAYLKKQLKIPEEQIDPYFYSKNVFEKLQAITNS